MNTRMLLAAGAVVGCMTAAAAAQTRVLSATQVGDLKSEFTLDFGQAGGTTIADVSDTAFEAQIDATTNTSRLLNYTQKVAPIMLPGGLSTGNITVTISESRGGTFDGTTFTTDDDYLITFDGDLSAFGLTSPVIFPGTSTGKITFLTANTGRVVLDWAGTGGLSNPFAPGTMIPFTYTCHVETTFAVSRVTPRQGLCGAFDLFSLALGFAPLMLLRSRRRRRR